MSDLAARLHHSWTTAWQEPLLCLNCGERLPIIAAVAGTPCPACSRVLVRRALFQSPRWVRSAAWLSLGLAFVATLVAIWGLLFNTSRMMLLEGITGRSLRWAEFYSTGNDFEAWFGSGFILPLGLALAAVLVAFRAARHPVHAAVLARRLQQIAALHALAVLLAAASTFTAIDQQWHSILSHHPLSARTIAWQAADGLVMLPYWFGGHFIALALPIAVSFIVLGRGTGVLLRNFACTYALAFQAVLLTITYCAGNIVAALEVVKANPI